MPFFDRNTSSVHELPVRSRVIIVGAGIHGVGVAHDLSTRGWKDVLVIEKGSVGSATSGWSTKLIHGGLRYLKRISQFSMVSASLKERKVLMNVAPDLVKPIELVYPIVKEKGLSSFIVKIGLSLYDFLAGRKSLSPHRQLDLASVSKLLPDLNVDKFSGAFSFWDCQTDDQALTERVAWSAVKWGALVAEGITVRSVEKSKDGFVVTVNDQKGETRKISSLYVINAAGPWANRLLTTSGFTPYMEGMNVRGSHILCRDLGQKAGAFFESPSDGRIFFVLPWMGFTLIGTTEKLELGDPDLQKPSEEEIDYLLSKYNEYHDRKLSREDIEYTFSGLRWLAKESKKGMTSTSREVHITSHDGERGFLLTIYGGKLTSYRDLAIKIGDELTNHFGEYKESRTDDPQYWIQADDIVPRPPADVKKRFQRMPSHAQA